jgi:hypothetical protein
MHSNTLSNILNRIPSKDETFDVEFLTQKLIEWNQDIEKEFIERPKIVSQQQPSREDIVSLSQLSSNIQHKLLEQIQNQNPSLYRRQTQHPLSQCGWKEVTMTNDSEFNALAQSMALSISSKSQCLSSSDTFVPVPNPTHILHLQWISELIRATKNIIRYNRILLIYIKNQRHAPSWKDPFFGLDSTSVLCSQGMIQLYLSILSQNSQWNSSKDSFSTEWNVVRDDLARQSATILFHATFAHAEEPCCKTALRMLQSREMNGPGILASLLLQPNIVHVMLALMKNVHNMMSVYPVIVSEMDASLQKLNIHDEEITMGGCTLNVLTILITTLSWCVHSPDFPGSTEDRRSDLAIEIIRVLFAIRGVLGKHQVKEMEDENQEIMTRLGNLIVYMLHLSNQNSRVYQCKLSVLMLLMDAPVEFSRFLRINNVIEELILIFWYQLNEFVVEKAAGNATSDKNSTSMLPILLVLNTLCKNDSHIREQVKAAVFPPDAEEEFSAKAKEKGHEKNMHPLDAPLGSTRHKLIRLLTHHETNLKRCCGELLWTLCGNDSKEFILRCGFGNAVHQLGVKGLYALPK